MKKFKLKWEQSENRFPIWYVENHICGEDGKPLIRIERLIMEDNKTWLIEIFGGYHREVIEREDATEFDIKFECEELLKTILKNIKL